MKLLGLVLVMLCVLVASVARAEEGREAAVAPAPAKPPALAELDTLKLRVLFLERAVIQQRYRAEKAEADFEFASKTLELERQTAEIAKRQGVDTTRYRLDVPSLTWKAREGS